MNSKIKQGELKEFHQMANERVQQKQYRLNTLKSILQEGLASEFGRTKEELENEIKELENYIYVATH